MNENFLAWLYTSFEGRLRRAHFWLGLLALSLVVFLVGLLLVSVLGLPFWVQTLASVLGYLLVIPIYAKRLHDRNKPAAPWLALFFGVPLLVGLAQYLRVGFTEVPLTPEQIDAIRETSNVSDPTALPALLQPNAVGFLLIAAAAIIGLWALIEMGFLRGTRGPNRFGPDPVSDG